MNPGTKLHYCILCTLYIMSDLVHDLPPKELVASDNGDEGFLLTAAILQGDSRDLGIALLLGGEGEPL